MSEPGYFARVDWPVTSERLSLSPATAEDSPALFATRTHGG